MSIHSKQFHSKRISRKTRVDPDGGFRINNELKPLIKRARDLGAAPSIAQIAESNRFININKQTGASANMSFFRDFALCPELNPMGGPRISFTRASSATRVNQNGLIELMGTNVARFDYDPVTRAAKGLLIEEARTNLFLRSEEIDNASWTKSAVSASANSVVSPDGLTTADTIIEDSTTNPHVVQQSPAIVNGTVYTLSFFAKAGSRSFAVATISGSANAAAWFNLSTGTVGTVSGAAATKSSTIRNFGDGWYRCVFTATGGATGLCSIGVSTGDGTISYTGNGVGSAYFWGLQIETGSFATSYIPTAGATATRARDIITISGNDFLAFFNPIEGTFLIDFEQKSDNSSANPRLLTFDSEVTDFIVRQLLNGDPLGYEVDLGNSTQGTRLKVAASMKSGTGGLGTFNGNTPISITNRTYYSTATILKIAPAQGSNLFNGYVKKLIFYSKSLVSSTLQSLTG